MEMEGGRVWEKRRRYVVRVWCESVLNGRVRVIAGKDFDCGVLSSVAMAAMT